MSSPSLHAKGHLPASGARRRGRPPAPQRRPGICLKGGLGPTWQPEGWENLSGRAQILLAASCQLDQQIHEQITLERMCRLLELDAHNLTAAFKHFHGCTMSAYLLQFRVRCLFHAMAVEPQANLRCLFRRFGLGPTPSERRSFRSQFGLSIEAHQQHCQGVQVGAGEGIGALPGPSAMNEALAQLAAQAAVLSSQDPADCGLRPA